MDVKDEAKGFTEFLESMPEEKRQAINELELKRAEEEYNQFESAMANGDCYICCHPLASFSKKRPCLHWLLKPKGFKKKHFKLIYESFSYTQLISYLRWMANYESPFININDMSTENSGSKVIELTIKHKNIEWSISCAESDLAGHASSQHSKHPHYHFQMTIDKQTFIRYNDFHADFHHADLLAIESERQRPDLVFRHHPFGEGMEEAFTEENMWDILENSSGQAEPEEGMFDLSTMIIADEGQQLDVNKIIKIINEAREKDVPIATLAHKIGGKKSTIISPGKGVPDQAHRSGPKKKRT